MLNQDKKEIFNLHVQLAGKLVFRYLSHIFIYHFISPLHVQQILCIFLYKFIHYVTIRAQLLLQNLFLGTCGTKLHPQQCSILCIFLYKLIYVSSNDNKRILLMLYIRILFYLYCSIKTKLRLICRKIVAQHFVSSSLYNVLYRYSTCQKIHALFIKMK